METADEHRYRRERENPSFSSTLLDVIYRSIDEREDENSVIQRGTMRKRQSIDVCFQVDQQDTRGVRRDCLIEKWMEKKISEKLVVRRKSAADFESSSQPSEGDSFYFNSSIGSSYSSCGGGFSSSEAESIFGFPVRPKPIRTTHERTEYNAREKKTSTYVQNFQPDDLQTKPKSEGKFVKTRSRALKIYGDLKKVKQPISPGGRLATFFNSLFTTGNAKKSKIPSSCSGGHNDSIIHASRKAKSANASTCSLASSFSRSCLSKAPSSRGMSNTDMQRSMRFYPVNVIVDEHCQPCGHKSLLGDGFNSPSVKVTRNSSNKEPKAHLSKKNHHTEETTRNLLKNHQEKFEDVFDSINNNVNCRSDVIDSNNGEGEDVDDDAASYASSDLFELDNLSAIGIDRYIEELPLYETTCLDANQAIARSFHV